MSRVLVIVVVLAGVTFSSSPVHAQAEAAIVGWLAQFAGEYALSKVVDVGYDYVTGKPDLKEMNRILLDVEENMRSVDQAHARSISELNARLGGKASVGDVRAVDGRVAAVDGRVTEVNGKLASAVVELRGQINDRMTREQVEAVVHKTMQDMKSEIDAFDLKVARLHADLYKAERDINDRLGEARNKVDKFRNEIGFLPAVPPAPLVYMSVDAGFKPPADPIMLQWANLLVRSEQNRVNLAQLRQRFEDIAAPVQAETAVERAILQETRDLQATIGADCARLMDEHLRLMRAGHKITSVEIVEVDHKLAPRLWLRMATSTLPSGPDRGRLRIPEDFMGPSCSDILEAFERSGMDIRRLAPIFRQLIGVNLGAANPGIGSIKRLPRPLIDLWTRARVLMGEVVRQKPNLASIQDRLDEVLKDQTDQAPEAIRLKQSRQQWAGWLEWSHDEADRLLNEATLQFLRSLKTERITSADMREFRRGVLLPLANFVDLTNCADWSKDAYRGETLARFLDGPAPSVSQPHPWYRGGLRVLSGKVHAVAVSPSGKLLAVGGVDGSIFLIDLETGEEIQRLPGRFGSTYALAFSPNGRQLAAGSANDGVRVWNVATLQEVGNLREAFGVGSLAFSPDGSLLAIGGAHPEVQIYETRTWTKQARLNTGSSVVNAITFSLDGSKLAAGGAIVKARSMTGLSQVWNVETRALVTSQNNEAYTPRGMFYATEDGSLVTGFANGTISFRDLGAKPAATSAQNPDAVASVAVSPGGKLFAVGGTGSTISLWDTATRKLVSTMRAGPDDGVIHTLAFAPDGLTLVSGSAGAIVRLWDLPEKREANAPR